MRVGFVFPHLSHGSPGSFQRTYLMCKALMEYGIDVAILTPFEEDRTIIHDVDIVVLPSVTSRLHVSSLMYNAARKFSSSSFTSRMFLSQSIIKQTANIIQRGLKLMLEKRKFDIIHAVQQPTALGCIPITRKHGIPIITDIHNIWAEESASQGYINSGDRVYTGLQNVEREILSNSDAVTVPSQYMKDYMKSELGGQENKIFVVPQGGFFVDDLLYAPERQENVVYSGMVSHREHVDLFANSIKFIKGSAHFYISDYGDMLTQVKKITSKSNYPHVNYVWFKDRGRVIDLLMKSRIGILTSANDTARRLGPPAKLFEYVSCGLPVIANNIGGWCEIIDEFNLGITTKDDPMSFAEAIDTVLQDSELWNRSHKNCLEVVKRKYNWNANARDILIPLYTRLVK